MASLLPMLAAVGAGAADGLENLLLNLSAALRLPERRKVVIDDDLTGKVCVVTGGNAGIGFATAAKLAERGAHVVLACRSAERGRAAAAELSRRPPLPGHTRGRVDFAQLDLCSLSGVRSFVHDFNRSHRRLDVLVCNAGIMSPPSRLVSPDGLELQFQVNFLSHWLLAHELLTEQRRRRARAQRRSGGGGAACCVSGGCGACREGCAGPGTRLVMLSSLTHHAGCLQWDDKQALRSYSPFNSYALSKMANAMAAAEFQRRFDRHDACSYGHDSAVAIHPGIVHTHLATGFFDRTGTSVLPAGAAALQSLLRGVLDVLYPLVLRSPGRSAESMLFAAAGPSAHVAGRYLHNDRVARPCKFAEDPGHAADLWALAEELTGVKTDASLI